MTTITGKPIVYGLTIPRNASRPDLAVVFLEFLLSEDGQAIMEKNGQPPIAPALTNDRTNLPSELSGLCVEAK